MKKRMFKDGLLNGLTYLFSSFGVLILVLIFVFIFSNGASSISFDLLKGDYYSESYTLKYLDELFNVLYVSLEISLTSKSIFLSDISLTSL